MAFCVVGGPHALTGYSHKVRIQFAVGILVANRKEWLEMTGTLVSEYGLDAPSRDCARVTSHSEVKTSPRLARSTEPEVGICEGKLTDSGWLKGPQKGSCDRFCIISDRRF